MQKNVSKQKNIVQLIFLISISIYIFYGIDFNNINFNRFSFFWLTFTFFSIFFSQLLVSIRWMKMSQLSFGISLETIIVSSALNIILPAKLGELSKALYLKKFYKYNYHRTLSIIFVERFFDIISLLLLLCMWVYSYSSNVFLEYTITAVSLFVFFVMFFFRFYSVLRYLKKIPFQCIRIYLQKFFRVVHQTLKSTFSISLYTFILWISYFISTVLFYSFAANFVLDMSTVLGLFIFSSIALAIPLSPAGIGTYEGAVVLFLVNYGVSKEDALVAATLYHILLIMVHLLLLYIFLVLKNIKFKELLKK